MQVAGTVCQTCHDKILTSSDGTWCAHCDAAYHTGCIVQDAPCARCSKPWSPPEQKFFRSQLCPLCGRRNNPPAANCAHCGTVTQWDNEAAYLKRRTRIKTWGRKECITGLLMIAASAALAAILFGVYTVALAFIVIPAGVLKMRAGLRATKFH